MAQRQQLTPPVMRRTASLNSHPAHRQLAEEVDHLTPL
jgi:hypothetical protein